MTRHTFQLRCSITVFCTLIFMFCPAIHALDNSAVGIDADTQLDYADRLLKNGDYDIAAGEYIRFIHFFPDDGRVAEAIYKSGVSYFKARRYDRAIQRFRTLIDTYPDAPVSGEASFMMSRTYLAMGEPGSAVNCLYNMTAATGDTDLKDHGNYEIGWIYLEHPWAVGHREQDNGYELFPETAAVNAAQAYFQKVEGVNRDKFRIDDLNSGVDRIRSSEWKRPLLAGTLSIVPGAGQVYCGRYQDGAVAFILNAAFIFAAYESFTNDSPVLGGLISVVGAGFYMGNIYGAVGDAHKYNRRLYKYKVNGLKEEFKIGLLQKAGQPALGLSFNTLF